MEPFKNLIDETAVLWLASRIGQVSKAFDSKRFVTLSLKGLADLELKARAAHVADALEKTLGDDGLIILTRMLESLEGPAGFKLFAVSSYIERHGPQHVEQGLLACAALTSRFTSEFCIRPIILAAWKPTLKSLQKWVKSPDEHLRRLVSEGTRTRLPWGMQLKPFIVDPTPVLPLLEALKDDPSEYVRRSVANNLNDLAKDHPDLVLEIGARWMKGASKERRRIVEHALRTLLKRGDERALKLLGAGDPKSLRASGSVTPAKVKLGERVTFSADLENRGTTTQHVVIEARVHFVRPKGVSIKPFRIARVDLAPKQKLTVSKSLELQHRSIRELFAGVHQVELQVNGVRSSMGAFTLSV